MGVQEGGVMPKMHREQPGDGNDWRTRLGQTAPPRMAPDIRDRGARRAKSRPAKSHIVDRMNATLDSRPPSGPVMCCFRVGETVRQCDTRPVTTRSTPRYHELQEGAHSTDSADGSFCAIPQWPNSRSIDGLRLPGWGFFAGQSDEQREKLV